MRYRNPIIGAISIVLGIFAQHLAKETSWAIVVEQGLETAAHALHIEKAKMVAYLSEVLILGGLIWLLIHIGIRIGQREKPPKEDPALQAQIAQTDAINAQTEAIKKPATQTVRSAFSQTQTINNFPPFLGGNMALQLDTVATLQLAGRYSMQMITLGLDTVPIDMRMRFDPAKIQMTGAQIFSGNHQQFIFDVNENKRR